MEDVGCKKGTFADGATTVAAAPPFVFLLSENQQINLISQLNQT